jgi:hypothetical protein
LIAFHLLINADAKSRIACHYANVRRLFEAGAFLAAATACFCSDDLDSPGSIDKLHWPSAFPSDLASARA